jgi:hypothetical protein
VGAGTASDRETELLERSDELSALGDSHAAVGGNGARLVLVRVAHGRPPCRRDPLKLGVRTRAEASAEAAVRLGLR